MPSRLTTISEDEITALPSAAACSVRNADFILTRKTPYCDELPQAILDVIAAEPTGTIAHSYRRYIRTVWVPGVQHVAELLKAHSAVIEWPTIEWLAEKFPKMPWHTLPNNFFANFWNAYTVAWEYVLAEWKEAENFAVLRPAYSIPYGGLRQAIGWSRSRGEAAQRELIGMTAKVEVDMSFFSNYEAATSPMAGAAAAFETEDT